jgi:O-antigen ligase
MRLERTRAPGEADHGRPLAERDRVLNPPGGQSTPAVVAFAVLAAVNLLTFGPVTWELAAWAWPWTYVVALLSMLSMALGGALVLRTGEVDAGARVLVVGCAALGLVILAPALVHWGALGSQPGYQSVNVAGVSAGGWIPQHWYFTLVYLLFPLLLLAFYLLVGRLRLDVVARIVAVCLVLSVGVQYYQGLVDWSFLNNWLPGSGRTGGLATDPNAYQLITFLMAPALLALALLDRRRGWALFTALVAVLAVGGLVFAGGRTATGGVLLLVLLSPLILAIAMRQWSTSVRLLLAIVPFMVLVAGWFVAVEMTDEIKTLGVLGRRIADSVERVSRGGLGGLLFDREFRGFAWQMGWLLLWRAPLAGWGAGGFLREYQNEALRETGTFPTWIDYVGNHYLMIPIDLGIPALLIQLAILVGILGAGFLALRRLQEPRARLAVTILLVAQLVFLIMIVVAPPYFPDAIFAWTLVLAVLVVIGERVGVATANWLPRGRSRAVALGVAGGLVAVSAVAAYPVTFGSLGYSARLDAEGMPFRYERNCHGIEQDGQARWRWCGRNARVKLPLPAKAPNELVLGLVAGNPDLQQNPLAVRYGGLAGPTQELTLANPPSAQIRIPLDATHVVEQPRPDGKGVERFAVLSLDVSRTWVPQAWGVNADPRELGVSVQLPGGAKGK